MKKLLAILLAMMMVLVSVVALAEPDQQDNTDGTTADGGVAVSQVTPTEANKTVTIKKTYTVQGVDAVNPGDTLQFVPTSVKVLNATTGTTVPDISIADVRVLKEAGEATITIALPQYTAVGEYYYTITENDTGVAGVTYLSDTIYLRVQVFQDPDSNALVFGGINFRRGSEDATQKIDGFTNTYEAGTLTVSKTVTGNMGDLNKEWNFTVVFSAPEDDTVMSDITTSATNGAAAPDTIAAGTTGWSGTTTKTSTFKLINSQSVKFSNIPKGVTYTVSEAEANKDGYTTTIVGNDGTISGHEDDTAAFTNTKTVDIDTGVALDSTVYMLIIALALAGVVVLKIRRREDY